MEDEVYEALEVMEEEDYFSSVSQGVRYCMDRKFEYRDGWEATTEQSDSIDERFAELGTEIGFSCEYNVSEVFVEDSRSLAEKVLEEDTDTEAVAEEYLNKYFE